MQKNDHDFNFPIVFVIMVVHVYSLFSIIVTIFAISYFLGIFWLIFVRDIEDWQNISIFDVYQGYVTFYTYPDYSFVTYTSEENYAMLVKMWYYAITTLSTIGFGDFSPKSVYEKILGAFILMFGVVVFSIIMNNLIEILNNFKQMEE